MNRQTFRTIFYVILFAVAMGFLESAVVIYLRTIYYPEGFAFPIKLSGQTIALTEVLREAATLVMLFTVSLIADKKGINRFAYFLLAFAVWDIFYYIFLKLLIHWPASFFTWDILFLIPFIWVGPVLAPIINSITMIIMSMLILWFSNKKVSVRFRFSEWLFLILGSFFTVVAYILPYVLHMLQRFNINQIFSFYNHKILMEYTMQFIPYWFNWWLFSFGELLIFSALILFFKRMLTNLPQAS